MLTTKTNRALLYFTVFLICFVLGCAMKSKTTQAGTSKTTTKTPSSQPTKQMKHPNSTKLNQIKTRTLFHFQKKTQQGIWNIVNDGVMGGLSKSDMAISAQKTAIFKGFVSLENYGGFASVRSVPQVMGLQNFEGIILRVKGDGKIYKLNIRADRRYDGVVYQKRFQTTGSWQEIKIPFSQLWPGWRGRRLSRMGPLTPSKIQSLGFLIADKQAGAFRLEIGWIKAYKK